MEALCVPLGFKPTRPWDEPGTGAVPLFFPLKQGGYALVTDARALLPAPGLPPPDGLPWLEVDGALYEQRADVEERLAGSTRARHWHPCVFVLGENETFELVMLPPPEDEDVRCLAKKRSFSPPGTRSTGNDP